jgi:hypothetical protein
VLDRLGEIAVEVVQVLLEPGDVLVQLAVQRRWCGEAPVALGGEQLDQLAAARHQRGEGATRLVREGPRLWPDRVGEVGEDGGIQAVGFGQGARGTGKVADLAGVDGYHGQAGGRQGCGEWPLQAAGGFQDDECGRQGAEAQHERGAGGFHVVYTPRLPTRTHRDIQEGFGDINADKLLGSCQRGPLAPSSLFHPALRCGPGSPRNGSDARGAKGRDDHAMTRPYQTKGDAAGPVFPAVPQLALETESRYKDDLWESRCFAAC